MHAVALVFAKVSVIDPAGHVLHTSVERVLYCPASHARHVEEPAASSVSVTEPGGHTMHDTVEFTLY